SGSCQNHLIGPFPTWLQTRLSHMLFDNHPVTSLQRVAWISDRWQSVSFHL
ncbi:hypothetical protein NDU88_002538, partial [Pleurodeles waltl]